MGIEPTWDSLHCPTPDLKSGSPTSELGTSGRFITKLATCVEVFVVWVRGQRSGVRIIKFKVQSSRFQVKP